MTAPAASLRARLAADRRRWRTQAATARRERDAARAELAVLVRAYALASENVTPYPRPYERRPHQ